MKSYAELKDITDWFRGISPNSEEFNYAIGYAVALLLWMRTQEAAEAEGIDTDKLEPRGVEQKHLDLGGDPPPLDKETADWLNPILGKLGDAVNKAVEQAAADKAEPAKEADAKPADAKPEAPKPDAPTSGDPGQT